MALFLPTVQHSLNILPEPALHGSEPAPPVARWTVESWLNGSFQQKYGKRREIRFGLRSFLVRTYNQLHYTLFHRVVSGSGTNVVIGKKNWLYEAPYIDKKDIPSNDAGAAITYRVNQLRKLQTQLDRIGVTLVFVLAPSKAEIYPEYIPDKLVKPPLPDDQYTEYQYAVAALKKNHVRFVDAHALFLEKRKNTPYQLFGPSGVHWNKYGAYLAWKEIAETANKQLSVPLRLPELKEVVRQPSDGVDADLGGLLNIWDRSLSRPKTDYPVFSGREHFSPKPSILVVGDSFMFTLIDVIGRAGLSTDVDAWYYFKRHFHYPVKDGRLVLYAPTEKPIDPAAINWRKDLLNRDLVLLVQTEYWLPELGFGFVETASEAIDRLQPRGRTKSNP
jgi:hypothetical protein